MCNVDFMYPISVTDTYPNIIGNQRDGIIGIYGLGELWVSYLRLYLSHIVFYGVIN